MLNLYREKKSIVVVAYLCDATRLAQKREMVVASDFTSWHSSSTTCPHPSTTASSHRQYHVQ